MEVGGLGLFGQLKGKMQWHHARQNVLAQNVANADTPNYKGRDFKAYGSEKGFEKMVGMRPVTTHSGHMAIQAQFESGPSARKGVGYETTPYRNSVTAEEEMIKVTQNQLDYQIATTVYQRHLGLLRTATRR